MSVVTLVQCYSYCGGFLLVVFPTVVVTRQSTLTKVKRVTEKIIEERKRGIRGSKFRYAQTIVA